MKTQTNLGLALTLIGDELADESAEEIETLDRVIGKIVRELMRIAAQGEPPNSEEVLDGFVRIAACATRAVADLGVDACLEGEGSC